MNRHSRWMTAGLSLSMLLVATDNWAVASVKSPKKAEKKAEISASSREQEREEALFVRRILSFWKDQEYGLVKKQIHQFLKQYPNSSYRDSLLVILGDTYWNEQNYERAVASYKGIKANKLQERIFNNYIDSLYHLEKYTSLEELLRPKVSTINEPADPEQQLWVYYYAEAESHLAKKEKSSRQQREHYTHALQYYQKLATGAYALSSKLAQADILAALDQPKEAAKIYKELADHLPEKKQELLLQAGRLQALYSPKDALLTFSELQHLNGGNKSEAALYKAYLLFDQGNFEQLLVEEQTLSAHLTPEQQQLLTFLIGRSHFALNHLDQATELLVPLLSESNTPNSLLNQRALLLTLLAAAYQRNSLEEVVAYSQEFVKSYPHDPLVPRILYLQATAYKNCDYYAKAEKTLAKLIKNYPDFEKKEAALFERNTLLYRQGLWRESRKAASQFAAKYPDSSWTPLMLQYIPSSTLKLLEEATANGEETQALTEQLIADITLVLQVPGAVTDEQRPRYLLKKAKSLYALKNYPEALAIAEELIKNYPSDPNLYQAHLLSALAYRDGLHDTSKFASHVEKALELNPDLQKNENLRVNLFSAYLSLAKERKEASNESDDLLSQNYVNQAADHLLQALVQQNTQTDNQTADSIKQENKLWLANYLYNKAQSYLPNDYWVEPIQQNEAKQAALRAKLALEKALNYSSNNPIAELKPESLALEQEYFKLAAVKGWLGETEEQAKLLKELLAQQQAHPDWKWALKNRVLYSYAVALEELGQKQEAQEAFLQTKEAKDLGLVQAAQLHLTRQAIESLPIQERKIESNQALAILKDLKELQIRKSLQTEPIHLEAALDHAAFRASLEQPEEREEQWLSQLKRMKEDFTTQEDICSRDYHAARTQCQSKEALYQSYLILVDAQIAQLEASKALRLGDKETATTQGELAESLYKHLLDRPAFSTRYLSRAAQQGLDSMHATLTLP